MAGTGRIEAGRGRAAPRPGRAAPAAAVAAATDRAARLLARIAAATADPPGVTRIAYGPGEAAAFALVAEAARAQGLAVAHDAAGNLFATLPGADRSRAILIGSHLDSVPHGGDFDGTAGVAMGLAVQEVLAAAGIVPAHDLVTVALRAEESCWFPHSYIGSKSALGLLEPGVLDGVRRSDSGRTLAEHIAEAGFDPAAVRAGRALLPRDRIAAFIEPHIEQGPALAAAGVPLAAVSGIRGSLRYRAARFLGAYAHSGATPRALRRDAVPAGARLVLAMERYWREAEARGEDLTVTFGEVATDPAQHSFSKVAGELRLCLDLRSASADSLARAAAAFRELGATAAAETGTRFDPGPESGSSPARMSPALVARLVAAAEACGLPGHVMASGAGHDAATFALAGIPAAMLFLRNANGSHNPAEAMDWEDFAAGLAVLAGLMSAPAAAWQGL